MQLHSISGDNENESIKDGSAEECGVETSAESFDPDTYDGNSEDYSSYQESHQLCSNCGHPLVCVGCVNYSTTDTSSAHERVAHEYADNSTEGGTLPTAALLSVSGLLSVESSTSLSRLSDSTLDATNIPNTSDEALTFITDLKYMLSRKIDTLSEMKVKMSKNFNLTNRKESPKDKAIINTSLAYDDEKLDTNEELISASTNKELNIVENSSDNLQNAARRTQVQEKKFTTETVSYSNTSENNDTLEDKLSKVRTWQFRIIVIIPSLNVQQVRYF